MSIYVDIEKHFSSFDLKVKFECESKVLGLLGASGCGKSITLKCICGLITPDRGKIIVNDKVFFDSENKINLTPQKRKTGYLFQNYALFPNMKIRDNIKIGITHLDNNQKEELMQQYINKFGLSGLEDRYPWQLSGGQMQRAALARALITAPDILLLDEPFSALDMHLRYNMEQELMSIINEYDKNVIFVTHDINEAYRVCDDIIVYENGKSLTKKSKHDLFTAPKTLSEAVLTGCKNISKAKKINAHTILAEDFGYQYTFKDEILEDLNYVCIRSHDIKITDNQNCDNTFPFVVADIIENPFDYTVHFKKDDSCKSIEFNLSKDDFRFKIGDLIYLTFSEEKLFYFN